MLTKKSKSKFVAVAALGAISSFTSIVGEPQLRSANAAESACVALLVGAGYAARMRVQVGGLVTDYSPTFAIGKTQCQKLDNVKEGQEFIVQVKANAGRTVSCPAIKKSSGEGSITFQASGTTLKPRCVLPR